ncbi:trypsin-like serine protease, partial [Streptomyces sp. 12297]
ADGTPAACTATLVGSRTVITAAHCVRTSTEGSPGDRLHRATGPVGLGRAAVLHGDGAVLDHGAHGGRGGRGGHRLDAVSGRRHGTAARGPRQHHRSRCSRRAPYPRLPHGPHPRSPFASRVLPAAVRPRG